MQPYLKNISIVIVLMLILNAASYNRATAEGDRLIQLSGMVTTADTSSPVPFATIRIKDDRRGTVANMEGFYTFVVEPGDTVKYSAMGFASEIYIVPDTDRERLRHVQPLVQDTLMLEEQVVFPWPTQEQFKRAFLSLDLDDDYTEQAQENLRRELLREINRSLAMDGREAQTMEMRSISQDFARAGGQTNYYLTPGGGTPVPSSLLNPMAWREFIQAIQQGDLTE